jgi:hypothetical protein
VLAPDPLLKMYRTDNDALHAFGTLKRDEVLPEPTSPEDARDSAPVR